MRPTQQDRATETRERILRAAVDCLYTLGYAGTTTTEVAKRAGVSRGAQSYHFATKRQLVVATVTFIFERRSAEFRTAITQLPESDRYNAAIDLLWQFLRAKTFYASLEVLIAARTDPELHKSVSSLRKTMARALEVEFADLFPELALVEEFRVIPDFLILLLEGMAVNAVVMKDDEREERLLQTLKTLGTLLAPLRQMLSDGATPPPTP